MFLNLKDGKLVLYELVVSKKINPVLEKMSYEGLKEEVSFKTTHWSHIEGRHQNKIIRFLTYQKTGKIIEYNDFFSEDEDEYLIDYYEYTLPKIYLILENIVNGDYKKFDELSKYYRKEVKDKLESDIFLKYQKEIFNYIYLKKILETDPDEFLNLIELLKKNSRGKLKTNLENINYYLGIYKLSFDGIKIKEKVKQ